MSILAQIFEPEETYRGWLQWTERENDNQQINQALPGKKEQDGDLLLSPGGHTEEGRTRGGQGNKPQALWCSTASVFLSLSIWVRLLVGVYTCACLWIYVIAACR